MVKHTSPRVLSVAVAFVVLTVGTVALRQWAWAQTPVLVLNTLVVATAAVGAWHVGTGLAG